MLRKDNREVSLTRGENTKRPAFQGRAEPAVTRPRLRQRHQSGLPAATENHGGKGTFCKGTKAPNGRKKAGKGGLLNLAKKKKKKGT